MTHSAEFEKFAACLRALKDRADLSYEALAQKTGISSSSLHRYCSGSYVPPDYGCAHRFATACGASREELRRLHRLWALADAARSASSAPTSPEPATEAETRAALAPDAGPARTVDPSRTADPGANPSPEPAADPAAVVDIAPAATARRGAWNQRGRLTLVASVLALALAAGAWALIPETEPHPTGATNTKNTTDTKNTDKKDSRLLFSDACDGTVGMGQQDACVREVQRLLALAGADIDVDSQFGPQTLRRVTAFQVLSGIAPNGVVGEQTKKALYAQRTRMDTWSPEKVRQRVREVFSEAPDRAAAIADCQSFLDPLHILPNTNGTRNWGVFQISDTTLRELGGTPGTALEPEWNIQAAHRLWQRTEDFSAWPHCDRAYQSSPTPTPIPSSPSSPSPSLSER
ncbi:helix-turn-helix domain-containing protein [Streptomyces phaeofaciens]|uniref:helix-turn-helix domain-containing protein n=1 Tax=Streptomyces phaeofaciens TaxID=68254 RepID=UPI00368CC7C6